MSDIPRIVVNGRPVDVTGVSPAATLLDWLRELAVRLDPPMTPERVLGAVQEIKQKVDVGG
jgi:hypothetical protein